MPNPLYDALFAPLIERRSALVILPDGTEISGDAFHAMCARVAGALAALGLQPGDRMAVQVEKSADALALYGGAVMAGVVFLPLNTAYTPDEVAYFLSDAGAKLLLADSAKAAALAPVADRCGARLMVLNADGRGSFADFCATVEPMRAPADRAEGDLAALLYTSGTTGRSKGAMLSQKNLLSNAEVLTRAWRFTAQDVLLHALPIFHTHGLFVATNIVLLAGGAMILLPKLDIDALIRWMPRATSLMGVPTFYTRLLDDARFTRDLVAHMRLFTSGSAPLLAETHVAFEARTGHRILERYGMTETNMNTSNPYDGERRAGTVGFPLPGVEVKVTDPETGATLPQGEIGILEVRGDNVFMGYWQMPEKTAAELRADGFFITGDLGRIDDDGYVTIVGRQKDLIIAGGYNIYPKEIELELDEAEGVKESAVIGVPHPDLGEGVLGVIVPLPGARPDTAAILADLGTRLARFKVPRALVVLPDLPRNTMGKVQKNLLRDQFRDWFTSRA
ncbi:MAG: malonyl-CoA synthase [Rhodobacter sp.]|uniref:malonate--CoA ligase n=1 Tax=Pararhodobacter sp. TaxID=2127056 RepID=UPI002BD5DA8B|nr:malonyl-CoA synthase [Pararhodobacter sp.]MCC0072997.1 malonyl-CoA synthase [Rhodobacter sp.]HPD93028.1 malonyl-CoA synthase [Pararhodobacter sp.]